jgi:hypothetical protein
VRRFCALEFLDAFFSERGFEDEMITGRIRKSLRMALACHAPGPDCFCVCCDRGPFLMSVRSAAADLETVCSETASPKGEAAIALAPGIFADASQADCAEKDRLIRAVDQTFQRRSYVSDGVKDRSAACPMNSGRIAPPTARDVASAVSSVQPALVSRSDKADGPDDFRREGGATRVCTRGSRGKRQDTIHVRAGPTD